MNSAAKKRSPARWSYIAVRALSQPQSRIFNMRTIAPQLSKSQRPLFDWADRHRCKPIHRIARWQIDRNLNVIRFEVPQ